MVVHHVGFVLRALVRFAHRVDGLVRAQLLGRHDGQQLYEEVRRVVVLWAADAEPETTNNHGKILRTSVLESTLGASFVGCKFRWWFQANNWKGGGRELIILAFEKLNYHRPIHYNIDVYSRSILIM